MAIRHKAHYGSMAQYGNIKAHYMAVLWHTMTAWWMVEQYGSIKAHYGQSVAGDGES